MAVAGDQQHRHAGPGPLLQRGGQGPVAGQLDAGHGADLALRQQAAVTFPDALLLRVQPGRVQRCIECGVLHGAAHGVARQVAAGHRHTGPHGGHDHRPVGGPGPAGVIAPAERVADLGFAGAGGQAIGLPALIGHLQHHGSQRAPLCQVLHRQLLQRLVFRGVVLLAQQQGLGGQQPVQQRGGAGRLGRCTGDQTRGQADGQAGGQQQACQAGARVG